MGVASDARYVALSPMPITSGELLRAAMMVSGVLRSTTAMAYAPITCPSASVTASTRVQLLVSLMYCMSLHEHFGVGFAAELASVFEQGLFEHVVVLDRAVVHYGYVAVGALVGVCVDVVGFAVCSPAGVCYADCSAEVF